MAAAGCVVGGVLSVASKDTWVSQDVSVVDIGLSGDGIIAPDAFLGDLKLRLFISPRSGADGSTSWMRSAQREICASRPKHTADGRSTFDRLGGRRRSPGLLLPLAAGPCDAPLATRAHRVAPGRDERTRRSMPPPAPWLHGTPPGRPDRRSRVMGPGVARARREPSVRTGRGRRVRGVRFVVEARVVAGPLGRKPRGCAPRSLADPFFGSTTPRALFTSRLCATRSWRHLLCV